MRAGTPGRGAAPRWAPHRVPGTRPCAHPGHSRVPQHAAVSPVPAVALKPLTLAATRYWGTRGHGSVPPSTAHLCQTGVPGHRGGTRAPGGTGAVPPPPPPVIPARATAPFRHSRTPGILPLRGDTEARLLSPSWHGSHVALYATGGGSPRPPGVPAVPRVGTAVVTARAVPALSRLPLAPRRSRPVIIPVGTPATSGRAHVPPKGTRGSGGTRGLRRGN